MTTQGLVCKITVLLTIISLTYCLKLNHEGSILKVGEKLYTGDRLDAPNSKCKFLVVQSFSVWCNYQKIW